MPDPPPPKRDRNTSLRLARAISIDETGFPLSPLSPHASASRAHPPVSPGGSSSSGAVDLGAPITRAISHQPSTSHSKRASLSGVRTERWVEAAMEYELDERPGRSQRLTSGMRKSFAIDEEDDDEDEDTVTGENEERPERTRRGVRFAEEDTVELLPDDGMRLESFERPRGRELLAIITSCAALAALALTAGFATVYDWVL